MKVDFTRCLSGTVVEDFPALHFKKGDRLYYRPLPDGSIVADYQPAVFRNVHSGQYAIGYLADGTLYLGASCIRNAFEWGAVPIGVIVAMLRDV